MGDDKVISDNESVVMFSNVDRLFSIHQEISMYLDTRFLDSNDDDCWNMSIGDIFLKLAEYLPEYAIYINNHPDQSTLVDSFKQKKSFINTLYRSIPEFDERVLFLFIYIISYHTNSKNVQISIIIERTYS